MDIKMKFGWEKGRRVITEMNVSLEPKYVIGNEEFVQRLGDAINKVVNHDKISFVIGGVIDDRDTSRLSSNDTDT